MKPICVPCHRFYFPKKNGFYFTEGMPIGDKAPRGLAAPERWQPYKLWVGDLWECPGCKAQIVVGVPPNQLAEHYEADFEATQKAFGGDKYQVNDC